MVVILIILIVLWLLGFFRVPSLPILHAELFRVLGHGITLWEILIFIVIIWAMEAFPSPFRQMAYVLVLLWVLSIFGFIVISGFSNILIFAFIIGLILALFQK